jgi:uncharacterized protein YukE
MNPQTRQAITDAEKQVGLAYTELDDFFNSMHDPKDFELKSYVADAADELAELLTALNRAQIEYSNEDALSLRSQITEVNESLDDLKKELAHITQVIGRIATVTSVLQQTISGLVSLATVLA